MFSNGYVAVRGIALATVGLLVTVSISHGQPAGPQGMGWIGGGSQASPYGGSSRGSSYSAPSYYNVPPTYYAPPAVAPSTPATTSYQSFYPPEPGSSDSAGRNRGVSLNVSVPASAQLWIEGVKTTETGTLRRFLSPPVVAGRDYTYDIKVAWKKDGKNATQTRHIIVHAGDVINLTFGPAGDYRASADTSPTRNN